MSDRLKTVMICDDEQDILVTFASILEMDYSVVTTSSGNQCMKTFIQRKQDGQKIHLLLVDFKLGDMTGDELAREIKILNGTKIILISAFEIDEKVISQLKNDDVIVEFLKKPVNIPMLRETISRVIQSDEDCMCSRCRNLFKSYEYEGKRSTICRVCRLT